MKKTDKKKLTLNLSKESFAEIFKSGIFFAWYVGGFGLGLLLLYLGFTYGGLLDELSVQGIFFL